MPRSWPSILKFPGWKMAGTPGTCMEVEKEGK